MLQQTSRLFKTFWRDQQGAASVASLILVSALLVFGVIVGLSTLREHIVTEFGDVAVGLDNLSQSFSYTIAIDGNQNGDFTDPEDTILHAAYIDPAATLTDPVDAAPACLNVDIAPTTEGVTPPAPTGEFP